MASPQMTVTLNQNEFRIIASALDRLSQFEADMIVTKQLTEMYQRAGQLTPVDTGMLRKTRAYRGNVFGYQMHYAKFPEFGTRFQTGQHYLGKNVDAQTPIFQRDLIEALHRATR